MWRILLHNAHWPPGGEPSLATSPGALQFEVREQWEQRERGGWRETEPRSFHNVNGLFGLMLGFGFGIGWLSGGLGLR